MSCLFKPSIIRGRGLREEKSLKKGHRAWLTRGHWEPHTHHLFIYTLISDHRHTHHIDTNMPSSLSQICSSQRYEHSIPIYTWLDCSLSQARHHPAGSNKAMTSIDRARLLVKHEIADLFMMRCSIDLYFKWGQNAAPNFRHDPNLLQSKLSRTRPKHT